MLRLTEYIINYEYTLINLEYDSLLSNHNSKSLTANNHAIDYIDTFSRPDLPNASKAHAIPIVLESFTCSGSQVRAFIEGEKPQKHNLSTTSSVNLCDSI